MNQDFMLKTESMTVGTKAVGRQHEFNTRSNSKDEARQAFSSELDKQVDKQERPKSEGTSQVKQSKVEDVETKGKDLEKRQVDETENKDGNTLPDEHSVESDSSAQEANESVESQIASEVLTPGLELKPEQSAQDVAESSTPTVNIVAEQVKQTELSTVKETVKEAINADVKKTTVQTDREVKKEKPAGLNLDIEQSNDESDKKSKLSLQTKTANIENKRVIDIAAQTQVADNKQQVVQSETDKVKAKIRPDILNALAKNQLDGKEKLAPSLNKDQTVMTSKVAANVLLEGRQMAELVSQVKPGLQLAGKTTDHGAGSMVTALTPAAGMTQGVSTPLAPTASTSQAVLDIQPSVQSEAWNRVLSNRVIWMAREGIQRAELKLNPANLGPVEVRLNMHNDQANVTFIAHHAATRDALEQALPRLRESFMENGFELTDAEVSQQDFEQANDNESGNAESSQSIMAENDDNEAVVMELKNDMEAGLSVYA